MLGLVLCTPKSIITYERNKLLPFKGGFVPQQCMKSPDVLFGRGILKFYLGKVGLRRVP